MTLDFLAWTEDEAILYVGLAFAGGGLYSGLMYGVIGFLSRKYVDPWLVLFQFFSHLTPAQIPLRR